MDFELSHLPDEALLHIFSFFGIMDLLSARDVCHRWRSIAESKAVWRKFDLEMGDLDTNAFEKKTKVPNRVFKFARILNSLEFIPLTARKISVFKKLKLVSKCEPFLDVKPMILEGSLEQIRNLNIRVEYTTLPVWSRIFSRFHMHLESLSLTTGIVLNEEPISFYLDVSGCHVPIFNHIKEPIISNCPKLKLLRTTTLNFNNGIFKLNKDDFPSLTHLVLVDARGYSFLLDTLQSDNLLHVLRNQLKSIKLEDIHDSNFKDISQFNSYFPNLEELHVILCFGEFRWDLKPLVSLRVHHYVKHHKLCTLPGEDGGATFHSIDNLTIRFCNHKYSCIHNFVKSCVKLTKLTLIEDCPSRDDGDEEYFEEYGLDYARRILQKLNCLQVLEMVGCEGFAAFDVACLRDEFPKVDVLLSNDRASALRKFSFFGEVLRKPSFTYIEDIDNDDDAFE